MAAACIPYRPVTQQTNIQTVTLYHSTNTPHANLPPEEALRFEIEKLCTATLTIDKAFSDVGTRLLDIASAAALTLRQASKNTEVRVADESEKRSLFTDLHNTCSTLERKWKEHHRAYIKLVWRSREFAGEAQAAVDDFRQMVLPFLRDRVKTPEEKRQLIQEQIELMQKTAPPSEQICQEFNDFSDVLDKYIMEFSRAVDGLGISEQAQRVSTLKGELDNAKTAMDSVSQKVKDFGWKFAKGIVPVVGVAALLAFVTPSLFAGLTTMSGIMIAALSTDFLQIKDSGGKLSEAWNQYRVAVADYKMIQAKYELECACLGQMLNLELTLQDARPLVQEVTVKLGVFACVWAAITADIRKLENSLRYASNPSSQLFIMRIENLERMYGYLSQALRHYQVTVRLPDQVREVGR